MENPPVHAPTLIAANHAIWGSDATAWWADLAARCQAQCAAEATSAAELEGLGGRIDPGPEGRGFCPQEPITLAPDHDLWIIGDLHGDLLSLHALTKFSENTSQAEGHRAAFCFLGDLFDDGPFGHVVLREVLSRLHEPGAVGFFVVGNHDLSPRWGEQEGRFLADVTPHDFVDWLNSRESDCKWREFGRRAIDWFARAPRALLLEDGTLIAHGGCVHSDRLSLLQEQNGWTHPDVLEDLVWLRAHESAKRKVPNRTVRGCQFGTEDFSDFLTALGEGVGRQIRQVIRGHDHVIDRWAAPATYEGRLITLNAMSWRQRDALGPFVRQPVMARHRAGSFPELFQLEIPAEHVMNLYGEPQTACVISAD